MFVALAQTTSPVAVATTTNSPLGIILFYIIATIVVAGAAYVVLAKNIVRQAIGLLFCLSGMSGLYLLLQAEFLAAVQLVVYVGGTLILIIFGVMLTSQNPKVQYTPKKREVLWMGLIATLLVGGLLALMLQTQWMVKPLTEAASPVSGSAIKTLGQILLDPNGYLAPFELVSIVLLAVMIGAAYLAKVRKTPNPNPASDKKGGM